MNLNANISRALRISKLRLVLLVVWTALLVVTVLHAQNVKSPATVEGNDKYKLLMSSDSLQTDVVPKRAVKPGYWIDWGLGWGGQGSALDLGFSYEVRPSRMISIHFTQVRTRDRVYDFVLFIPVGNYPMGEDASAVDVSYGLLKKGKGGIISLSAGLSVVTVKSGEGYGPPSDALTGWDALFNVSTKPANYWMAKSTTVGLALRAQLIPSLRTFGIGISPYVNINGKYTFASVTVQLAGGRFRPRRV